MRFRLADPPIRTRQGLSFAVQSRGAVAVKLLRLQLIRKVLALRFNLVRKIFLNNFHVNEIRNSHLCKSVDAC
jgi:hypothetical protein